MAAWSSREPMAGAMVGSDTSSRSICSPSSSRLIMRLPETLYLWEAVAFPCPRIGTWGTQLGADSDCKKLIAGLSGGFRFQRLGDDGDVGDAGLLDRIHDAGECAEGNPLVGAQINNLVGRIGALLVQL